MPEWIDIGRIVAAVAGGILVLIVTKGFGFVKWTGAIDTKISSVESRIGELAQQITNLTTRIDAFILSRRSDSPAAVQGASPVVLTDVGKEIAREVKADTFAQETAPKVLGQVRGKEEFEVYEFCQQYVLNKLPQRWERDTAKLAYQRGTDTISVRQVLAVVLRDKLLLMLG
ncbi:MAG: hypothetical protein OXE05_03210 [Chloroflexi bacterium]|nr:hypothetical protein [Chloroflexota bacterium]